MEDLWEEINKNIAYGLYLDNVIPSEVANDHIIYLVEENKRLRKEKELAEAKLISVVNAVQNFGFVGGEQ